jgi:hypothetical protein
LVHACRHACRHTDLWHKSVVHRKHKMWVVSIKVE